MYHASGKPRGYGSEHASIIRVPADVRVSERYGSHVRTHVSLAADVYAHVPGTGKRGSKRVRTLGVDGPRAQAERKREQERANLRAAGVVGNIE